MLTFSYAFYVFLVLFCGLCIDLFASLVFCMCVSGGGSRRSNPSRDTGSKRLGNPGEAPEGSTAPKRSVKTSASKHKEPAKGMDEIPQSEFVRGSSTRR